MSKTKHLSVVLPVVPVEEKPKAMAPVAYKLAQKLRSREEEILRLQNKLKSLQQPADPIVTQLKQENCSLRGQLADALSVGCGVKPGPALPAVKPNQPLPAPQEAAWPADKKPQADTKPQCGL